MTKTQAKRIAPIGFALLLTVTALCLSYGFRPIRLDSRLALWTWRLTMSGGLVGVTILALACAIILTLRAPRTRRRVLREFVSHVLALSVFLGGGALANEHLLKPCLAVHRPNVVALAEQGILGISSSEFYTSMDKDERRAHLEQVLGDSATELLQLSEGTRNHWIQEAGFSFPSGHAFSSTLLATYYLVLLLWIAGNRRPLRAFHLLPIYAVCIGWSRVLLGVHRPIDVLIGGVLGFIVGVAAAWAMTCLATSCVPKRCCKKRRTT